MNEEISNSEKKKEDWMNSKWRPMMGWTYMGICILDMAIFPVLWSVAQVLTHQSITQWDPLTLRGAGLFHIAMGAVLGIAAYGRTKEKMSGSNNGGLDASALGAPTTPTIAPAPTVLAPQPVTPVATTSSFSSGFNSGFGAPAAVTTNASGKKVVPQDPQPTL